MELDSCVLKSNTDPSYIGCGYMVDSFSSSRRIHSVVQIFTVGCLFTCHPEDPLFGRGYILFPCIVMRPCRNWRDW